MNEWLCCQKSEGNENTTGQEINQIQEFPTSIKKKKKFQPQKWESETEKPDENKKIKEIIQMNRRSGSQNNAVCYH